MVEHKNESLEMDLTGSALSTKAGGTVMLVVKGAFDMRPPRDSSSFRSVLHVPRSRFLSIAEMWRSRAPLRRSGLMRPEVQGETIPPIEFTR